MSRLSFFVPGFPQTQGGMKQVPTAGGPRLITTGSAGLTQWRKTVTNAATTALMAQRCGTFDGPVACLLNFYLPMPASRPSAVRHAGIGPAVKKWDLDKLRRAVYDSLTNAKVWGDDGQVVHEQGQKVEVADLALCGVAVQITSADAPLDHVLEKRLRIAARIDRLTVARFEQSRKRGSNG